MKKAVSFGTVFTIAISVFVVTMLTKSPVSESRPVPRIDTIELTL